MNLLVKGLACGYKDVKVVDGIEFSVKAGETLCILGPNGVGKTTFYKTLLGFIPSLSGSVTFNDDLLHEMSRRDVARLIAYVPQASKMVFGYDVIDVLIMGRYTHMGRFSMPSKKDRLMAVDLLKNLGIESLAHKSFNKISGGEQQMVLIARAIIQGAKLIIMDEPTSSLDYGNQLKVLKTIEGLREKGTSVIMTSHEPEHAYKYSTKAMILYEGKMDLVGDPKSIITEEKIREIYDLEKGIDLPMFSGRI